MRRTMSEDGKHAILALERQLRSAGFVLDALRLRLQLV
jgi:hypothetical protein